MAIVNVLNEISQKLTICYILCKYSLYIVKILYNVVYISSIKTEIKHFQLFIKSLFLLISIIRAHNLLRF